MPLFRKPPAIADPFRKNETVIATEDLPGVPEGTRGQVKLINGFDWVRYWVFFENGVDHGSIDGSALVRPQHWRQFQRDREQRAIAEEEAALRELTAKPSAAAATTTAAGAEAAAEAPAADDPNAAIRAMVPAHLLEKAKEARARLTGG